MRLLLVSIERRAVAVQLVEDPLTCRFGHAELLRGRDEDHREDNARDSNPQAAIAVLGKRFGKRVAKLMAAVISPAYVPGGGEHEQYCASSSSAWTRHSMTTSSS